MVHNAVELPVDLAWSIADRAGRGSFPGSWPSLRPRTAGHGRVARPSRPAVTNWLRVVCHPQQWFELRYVRTGSARPDLLRGIIARRDGRTVVALRNAQLLTLTEMRVEDPLDLAPILTAGLDRRPPATFAEFVLPARVGARADEQLRNGAEPGRADRLFGVPASAVPVVRSALSGPRSYVEVVAGQNRDGVIATSAVGLAVIDSTAGGSWSPRIARWTVNGYRHSLPGRPAFRRPRGGVAGRKPCPTDAGSGSRSTVSSFQHLTENDLRMTETLATPVLPVVRVAISPAAEWPNWRCRPNYRSVRSLPAVRLRAHRRRRQ